MRCREPQEVRPPQARSPFLLSVAPEVSTTSQADRLAKPGMLRMASPEAVCRSSMKTQRASLHFLSVVELRSQTRSEWKMVLVLWNLRRGGFWVRYLPFAVRSSGATAVQKFVQQRLRPESTPTARCRPGPHRWMSAEELVAVECSSASIRLATDCRSVPELPNLE